MGLLESKIRGIVNNEEKGSKVLVKMRSNGSIVVPKHIQEEAGIKEGDYLITSIENDKIVFRKVEIDWENPDDVWKEYATRRLTEE